MSLLTIEEAPRPEPEPQTWRHHPVWRLGFRPFYLLAAAFAALSIPLWIARYFGYAPAFAHVDLFWHMHEMVFGFAIAVIVGFLFTAGRAWTGLWTPRRGTLAALAGLWLAGRVAMLTLPPPLAAVIDLAFLPAAAWPFYRVLKRSGNKRNLFLVGLLGLLTLANLAFHGAALGLLPLSPIRAVEAAILLVVMIESAIGARVIPNFTANAVPGTKPIINERRDRVSMTLTAAACVAWIAGLPAPLCAALAFTAACSQVLRLAGWKPHRTVSKPILWILHLSYAWIPVGFVLLALAALQLAPASAAFHALAVGSMAGLIIGMITRTALGHTGRPLTAGRAELAMYLLVQAGALARLCAALGPLSVRGEALVVAAACWGAAFALYLVVYSPYLLRPRLDGKEG
jgi:uncharacterized protein involved in response to NO